MFGRLIAIGLGLVSFAVVLMVALPANLFGRGSDATTMISAQPPHIAVVDGDTMRLRDTLIRLRGVRAPARGEICRTGPLASDDCGALSSIALAGLVRGHTVSCEIDGHDRRGFALARCDAAGVNLNQAIVAAGWARAEPTDAAMQATEAEARRAARGLWWANRQVPL